MCSRAGSFTTWPSFGKMDEQPLPRPQGNILGMNMNERVPGTELGPLLPKSALS